MKILTRRNYDQWPSNFVVYEWEDIFQNAGNIEFQYLTNGLRGKIHRRIINVRSRFDNKFPNTKNPDKLVWIMNANQWRDFAYKGCIPIFLDFPVNMVLEIATATRMLPYYWVTCFDIYEQLQKVGSTNVHYMPLSISDKWVRKDIPPKSVDIIQFGRKNKILHKYALRYTLQHPNIEYVYQTDDGSLTYISTKRGIIGRFDSREDYMKLLASCKVSIVSSPGADSSRTDFGGVDFITPRFYESAVNYSYMLGRYTENEEVSRLNLPSVCPLIENYEMFRFELDRMLFDNSFYKKVEYDTFINQNITSKRYCEIMNVLDS